MEPKNKDKDKDAEPYSGWWLLGIAALGAILCALLFFGFEWTSARNGIDKLGQMGDFFGGMLNPLVSALTLFVAIRVWQFQEKELQATQKALDEQAKTAEQQRQEQRFFDLLNVYYKTVDGASFTHRFYESKEYKSHQYNGKEAMAAWLNASPTLFRFALNKDIYGNIYEPVCDGTQNIPYAVSDDWKENQANEHFGSYFCIVRHLLTEAQDLLGEQHHRYVALFAAQLSRSELVLLALHLWLDPEGQAVQHLASKYGLLKNLPKSDFRTKLESELPIELFGAHKTSS